MTTPQTVDEVWEEFLDFALKPESNEEECQDLDVPAWEDRVMYGVEW